MKPKSNRQLWATMRLARSSTRATAVRQACHARWQRARLDEAPRAAAACLAVPTKAWAGYALGAAAVAEHSTVATGKEKEKAVYDSVRAGIDAKRPDRPDVGTRAPAPYPYCCCHR